MRKKVGFYLLIAFLFACLIGTSVFSTYEAFVGEGPLPVKKEIVIDKGMPLKQIANYLKAQGVIDSPAIFVLGVRANGKGTDIKAGEYSIPARASSKMVMDILTSGQTVIRKVLIPEGLTSYQIVQLLNKTDGLTGEITEIPPEGSLLPQTYYFSRGDAKQQIVTSMKNEMQRTINELWSKRAENLLISTPQEAIILASIVEKETSKPEERSHIASVFFNRLAKKMRLQSDPTVIYALSDKTGVYKKQLWSNDLKKVHPYNTYYIYGLPPTAIANPGKDAIEAVLHPMDTKDLYFVANGTGGHAFSETYKEHQNRVNEWREIKNGSAKNKKQKKKTSTSNEAPSSTAITPKHKVNADQTVTDSVEFITEESGSTEEKKK